MADDFKDVEKSLYVASYQSLDGSNYSLAGLDFKLVDEKDGSLSYFVGGGFDFAKKSPEFVMDLKGKVNYTDNFNMNARVRTKVGKSSQALQVRLSPISADIPVAKNTSIYATPYYKMQTDLHGNTKHSIGGFTGVNHKFSKRVSGFAEVEYNNKKTDFNIGGRVTF